MSKPLKNLLQVIDELIGPEGCPWDRAQTPQTLCDYLTEETFELIAAIRADDENEVREEMGDVFFLLFFISRLYMQSFSLEDAWDKAAAKMVRRHPHVFEKAKIKDQEELFANWERIKKQEKNQSGTTGVFASLPAALPPLLKAYRINSKAARNNFTWKDISGVEEKLKEEWAEWKEALDSGDPERMEEELGDYLFTLAEYARRHKIKPNTALDKTNHKFLRRFREMEDMARDKGQSLSGLSMEEKEELWGRTS